MTSQPRRVAYLAVCMLFFINLFTLISPTLAAPACIAPPAGMVSRWTGDSTTADFNGINNGTLNNGATML